MLHAVDDLLVAVVDLADRGDDGGGAAHTALDELVDLVEADRALLDLHAEVLGHLHERAAGDGGKDGVGEGLRDDELALLGHEEHVRAAGLLDVGAGLRVEEEVVGIAGGVGEHAGVQRHGVVEAGLDVAGAVGRGAVELGNDELDGLDAALVVRADRSDEDAELILVGGLHADDVARGEHERADVERGAGAEGRHPGGVGLDDLLNGLDELILGEGGHLEAGGGVVHALRVHVGTEADDGAVFGGVGLEALEDLLAVVKQAGALGERDGVVGGELALAPLAVFVVADIAVVGVLISEAEATPVDVLLLHHALHLLASARPARHWYSHTRLVCKTLD